MLESSSGRATTDGHTILGFSPLYPFRLVGRGIRGLVRRGLSLRRPRSEPSTPVASLSGAFMESGGYYEDAPYRPVSASVPIFSHHQRNGAKAAFPLVLRSPAASSWEQPQRLLAVGTRKWGGSLFGGMGGLVGVRLYDYAVYADPAQVHHSLAPCVHSGASCPLPPTVEPSRQLNAAHLDMALTVHASRSLPIALMRREYRAILQRRLAAVGGSPDDPALSALIALLTPATLPPSVLSGSSVRRGAQLSFVRAADGALTAVAAGQVLGTVRSKPLCQALFDLYLGDQPVCPKSKAAAGEAMARLARDPHRAAFQLGGSKDRLLCDSAQDLDSCLVQLN